MIKHSKNLCEVKIKADRICYHCKEVIPKGTKCLTINSQFEKRRWMCPTCMKLAKEVSVWEARYNAVPFDDEGGALATSDMLEEVRAEFEYRERS